MPVVPASNVISP